ncbi:hypothetical protein HPP92_004630 [Vanilla planifolia]|uniref:Uncharacterized protein n=1 Tax=Vanilla planifolia TaxID=51239 RepID=A0A835VAJ8_VANPL|nr:hypothetical protein HPP92_004985 [Vanilla planifolia]KAG0493636.1 hypothetical protein HPP92_004630 [Vanilla planifolia]
MSPVREAITYREEVLQIAEPGGTPSAADVEVVGMEEVVMGLIMEVEVEGCEAVVMVALEAAGEEDRAITVVSQGILQGTVTIVEAVALLVAAVVTIVGRWAILQENAPQFLSEIEQIFLLLSESHN